MESESSPVGIEGEVEGHCSCASCHSLFAQYRIQSVRTDLCGVIVAADEDVEAPEQARTSLTQEAAEEVHRFDKSPFR